MISIPVVTPNGTDILDVVSSFSRGDGSIILSGSISLEIENELQKALRFATELASYGEFSLPDFSIKTLRISFKLRRSDIPISGHSYGLGLAMSLFSLFSARDGNAHWCYSGGIGERGELLQVECLEQKIHGATAEGFTRIFVPKAQLNFFENRIQQVAADDIFEAWGFFNYGLDHEDRKT